jgi:trk system potassium uptake protein TrkA
MGSHLANRFSVAGHSLVMIDIVPDNFNQLNSNFSGFTIEGDATEMSILNKAKIASADMVIAATRNDNINLMVAQIAQDIYHVPVVLARVYDPQREIIYQSLKIQTICPTTMAVDEIIRLTEK